MAVVEVKQRLQHIVQQCGLQQVEIEAGTPEGPEVQFSWGEPPVDCAAGDRLFLVASITKSVVATLAMKLVAEGSFSLSERVTDWLPELPTATFRRITIRHLLTHTCGLPDQLPNNSELRAAQADLDQFLEQVGQHGTEFTPGADCRYSSMGFLLLGAIIAKATQRPLATALQEQLFVPAEMSSSWLGIPRDREDLLQAAVPSLLPPWQADGNDWDWNSRYWRTLGAPWGGLLSTTADLGRLCRTVLRGGTTDNGTALLSAAAVDAFTQEQTQSLFQLPDSVWRKKPWGYGWRFAWPEHVASFGDLVPWSAVGHWGATGTLFWLDPERRIYVVVLTSTPFEDSRFALQRLSNTLAAELSE